jgi:hypothetical protein
MGLASQQGPPSEGAIGRFLVRDPLPERMSILPHQPGTASSARVGHRRLTQ